MRSFFLLPLAAMIGLAAPREAPAQPAAQALVDQLYALTEPCRDLGRPRRIVGRGAPPPEEQAVAMLGWMLSLESPLCRDLPARAAARIDILIGTPERPDVPLAVLALGWRSAAEGRGRVYNPELAERYGRVLWLLSDEPPSWPGWTEARQRQWLARPEQIALLESYLAGAPTGRQRQARLLAELRLRRDLPGYDPRRAAELFGRAGDLARQAELLSDGSQISPQDRSTAGAAGPPPPREVPIGRSAPAEPAQLAATTQEGRRDMTEPPVVPVQPGRWDAAPIAPPARQAQSQAPAPRPSPAPPPPMLGATPIQQARREAPPPQARSEEPSPARHEPLAQPIQRQPPAHREPPVLAMRETPAQPPPREAPFRATPLQLGQRAAESAQTDQERIDALRTLFAASLAGGSEACTALAAQLGRVRPSTYASLTREDLGRIERALGSESSGITLNPGGRALRPVLTRGLIDSSGRLVMAQMVSSSGSTGVDQAVMAGWLRLAGRLTLSARPSGAAWVPLPPSFPTGDGPTEPTARSSCL